MTTAKNLHDEPNAPTTQKVANVAHEAIDGAASKAQPVEEQIRTRASKAGEQLDAKQAAAIKQMEQSMKQVESFVRERPVAATGIAFAAGALAAMILRR
jgi:ElaB/YqjD/DUF883 family membrane-anchored ribosome-binding protein